MSECKLRNMCSYGGVNAYPDSKKHSIEVANTLRAKIDCLEFSGTHAVSYRCPHAVKQYLRYGYVNCWRPLFNGCSRDLYL